MENDGMNPAGFGMKAFLHLSYTVFKKFWYLQVLPPETLSQRLEIENFTTRAYQHMVGKANQKYHYQYQYRYRRYF